MRKKQQSAAEHCPAAEHCSAYSGSRSKCHLQTGGVLLSLCGMLACNYLGLGLGKAVCHGLFVASLGAPTHRKPRLRVAEGR